MHTNCAVSLGRKVARHAALGDADAADAWRRIAAPPDEARHAIGDHGADCGNVAILDRIERGGFGSPAWRVEQDDIGVAPGGEQTGIEAIDARV